MQANTAMQASTVTFKASKKEKLLSGLVLVLHCAVMGLAIMVLVTPNRMFGDSSGLASLQINGTAFDLYIVSIGSNNTTGVNKTTDPIQTSTMSTTSVPIRTASITSTTATPSTTVASVLSTTPGSTTNATTRSDRLMAGQDEKALDPSSLPNKLRRRKLIYSRRYARHT